MTPIKSFIIALGLLFAASHACADPATMPAQFEITVAPIDPPYKYSIENRGGPLDLLAGIGFLASKNIEKNRQKDLTEIFSRAKFDARSEFESSLLENLKSEDIKLLPSSTLKTYKDDPTAIDFQNSTEASKYILLAKIEEIGLYSGRLTSKFEPKLNASFELIERTTEKSLYYNYVYYGADARKDSKDQILANSKFQFLSYEDAIEHKDELIESLREGIAKITKLAAQQISNTVFSDNNH